MNKIKPFLAILLAIITTNFYSQNLAWAQQFNSTAVGSGYAITRDASGNIYSAGGFQGTVDLDPGVGVFTLTAFGSSDIFVSKLDPNGNFVWAKQIGGTSLDAVNGIAIDVAGNICLVGNFNNTCDFDPGPSTFTLSGGLNGDIFVCKLDASGNFIWAKSMGGTSFERGYAVTTDPSNNIYTTGYFRSLAADFDPGPSSYTMANIAGTEEVFVSKLDASGNFVWAKQMGGSGTDQGFSIAIDALGNVITVGSFASPNADFDPGVSTYTMATQGLDDIFVNKLDPAGNFIWTKQMGGSGGDFGNSVKIDASNNIYIGGYFNTTVDFDPSLATYTLTSFGGNDIYISKLDVNGNFLWASQMGGAGVDVVNSISIDAAGNCYSTGYFTSAIADFNPGAGTYTFTNTGANDIFVSQLNASGNFLSAYQISGTGNETGRGITCDNSNNVYLTGDFQNTTDFDPGAATYTLSTPGVANVFVCKLNNLTASVKNEFNSDKQIISIYPNPNQGQFRVKLKELVQNGSIEITNVLGEVILTKNISESDSSIQIPNLIKGIYFVKILENTKVIAIEKIVLQ